MLDIFLFFIFFVCSVKQIAVVLFVVVCWVVVTFSPHGKKIKPRRAFKLKSCKLAEIVVLVVSNNLARFWSGYDVATVCGKDSNQFDDVVVVVASVNYEVDNFTKTLTCYVYESTVELLSVHSVVVLCVCHGVKIRKFFRYATIFEKYFQF